MAPVLQLSAHALLRMRERGIARAWVERVAMSPEWTEADPHPGVVRAFGRVEEAGGRVLRVVYTDRGDDRIVLTVMLDRTRKRSRRGR